MELAHEIPPSGDMGKEKIRHRILQRFYWPTFYKHVEEYCHVVSSVRNRVSKV